MAGQIIRQNFLIYGEPEQVHPRSSLLTATGQISVPSQATALDTGGILCPSRGISRTTPLRSGCFRISEGATALMHSPFQRSCLLLIVRPATKQNHAFPIV